MSCNKLVPSLKVNNQRRFWSRSFNLSFLVFFFSLCFSVVEINSQTLPAGIPVIEEAFRRNQLLGDSTLSQSFALRPLQFDRSDGVYLNHFYTRGDSGTNLEKAPKNYFRFLPIRQTFAFNSKRPYGWGNGPMVPNVGIQTYTQVGFTSKISILRVQFAPEFVWSQNKPYQGFESSVPSVINAKFRYWSFGDFPERFGSGPTTLFWWGQSKVTVQAGFLETGISTENIWWGPGQFSALTFSNNARSFPHFTLKSRRPAKTFLGAFEGEMIIGRLEDSGISPSQIEQLNEDYFFKFSGDHKYLNAMTITYQPKWINGLYLGFARTFQQYSAKMGTKLSDYLPVFEPFQKTVFGFDRDSEGRDQQSTFFGRWVIPEGKAEVYFEYGRRDHGYNWREAMLNPEHARAYLVGFQKLWATSSPGRHFQIRSEMLHQQESINRIIRYVGLGGGYTWHTHGQARGFTNFGEALGTGFGVGSNVQTFEISFIEGINKKGIVFERLANHQDSYYRAFGNFNSGVDPWIDLSLGILWDHQFDNLTLSTRSQIIYSSNYQWQTEPSISRAFNTGQNLWAFFGQVNLIYHFGK